MAREWILFIESMTPYGEVAMTGYDYTGQFKYDRKAVENHGFGLRVTDRDGNVVVWIAPDPTKGLLGPIVPAC